MTTPEAARLAALHHAAFAPARGWTAAEMAALLKRSSARLVSEETGFALADLVGDEAELLTIAVHPDARRRGMARRLLTALHARLMDDGARKILLDVSAENTAARALYHGFGYAEIARRKAYYRVSPTRRVDALVLSLPLSTTLTAPK